MTKPIKTMLEFIVKTGKIGFWFLMPLFLISNTGYEVPVRLPIENGKYLIKVSGIVDTVLTGQIMYTDEIASSNENEKMIRLELRLDHAKETVDHRMGFVISKHISVPDDLVGIHKVSTHAAGITNNFDGIFGFADIGILGEQPFFTDHGTVYLTHIENGLLHGNLSLTLRNIEGQKIDISGSFIATGNK